MGESGTDCYRKAADLLARRPHFRRELEEKLTRRGFERDAVAGALERLAELGFLDDAECARQLAAGAFRRRGYGPRRTRAELERRGAAAEAVEEALAATFPEGDLERAREVAGTWRSRKRSPAAAALARHLERKGFTNASIRRVLAESEAAAVDG